MIDAKCGYLFPFSATIFQTSRIQTPRGCHARHDRRHGLDLARLCRDRHLVHRASCTNTARLGLDEGRLCRNHINQGRLKYLSLSFCQLHGTQTASAMSTDIEKKNEVQLEDTSSGDVAPQEEIPPPYDEMNLQAFLAILVSCRCSLQDAKWLRRLRHSRLNSYLTSTHC